MPSYTAILAADADANLAVSSAAVQLTLPSIYSAANRQKSVMSGRGTIQVRTAPVLFTLNGTAPTDADESTGTKLGVGDFLRLTTFAEMVNLNLIRATGSDGAVFYFFERRVA